MRATTGVRGILPHSVLLLTSMSTSTTWAARMGGSVLGTRPSSEQLALALSRRDRRIELWQRRLGGSLSYVVYSRDYRFRGRWFCRCFFICISTTKYSFESNWVKRINIWRIVILLRNALLTFPLGAAWSFLRNHHRVSDLISHSVVAIFQYSLYHLVLCRSQATR